MAATTRAAEKAERRRAYLKAGARLFAEHGYRSVSIEDLGAAVGVSGPAFYNHFASKDDMLLELLTDVSERLLDGFDSIVGRKGDDRDVLQRALQFHLDFAVLEPDVIRLQDRELANLPKEASRRVRAVQRRYVNGWKMLLHRLRPDLSADELEIIVHALFGVLNSTPYSRSSDSAADAKAVLLSSAVSMLAGTLRGPTPMNPPHPGPAERPAPPPR